MFSRLSIAFAVAALLGFPHSAGADPITYDFSGTLDPPSGFSAVGTQLAGIPSGPFTGSITFNDTAAQQVPGDPGDIDTPDVTARLNIIGESFQYANPSDVLGNQFGLAQVHVYFQPFGVMVNGLGTVSEGSPGYSASFFIDLSNTGLPIIYPNQYAVGAMYPTIDLSKFDSRSISLRLYGPNGPIIGNVFNETGVITSFDVATVPEPSSMAICTVLALAAATRRMCRGLASPSNREKRIGRSGNL
jgi:hypothetical protein